MRLTDIKEFTIINNVIKPIQQIEQKLHYGYNLKFDKRQIVWKLMNIFWKKLQNYRNVIDFNVYYWEDFEPYCKLNRITFI